MKSTNKTQKQLIAENEDLRARLEEAEEVLRAIHNGEVDALIVSGADGEQIFTLKQAEEALREQSTLLDVSHTLASTLELKPDLILDQLRTIITYSHAALFVLEDSSLIVTALRGVKPPKDAVPFRISLDNPETITWLFNEHRPIRIADVSSADVQARFFRSVLDKQAAMLLDGMRAWMWVPLAVKNHIIGGMGVAHVEQDYFTSHDSDLALIVANQAAITMINAELYGQAQALAVLEERQRLARNLHDAINQSLFAAGLIAEVLPRLWDRDQAQARNSLEDLRRLTRGAQAEMRALLAELRPATLTDSSLGDLLHLLGNALSGRLNLPVTVTVTGDFKLPSDVQIAFYRISQETLSNIAKHAKASRAEIDLDKKGDFVELRIRDDGQGFDLGQSLAGHYGLGMMRERAEAVGAQLNVTSQPGHGTELTLRWMKTPYKES
jgi:signal transduction histidine kinase